MGCVRRSRCLTHEPVASGPPARVRARLAPRSLPRREGSGALRYIMAGSGSAGGLFVPKPTQHSHDLSRYNAHLLVAVRWSPPVSLQDRVRCH
jgi:hypothetical protein